MRDSFHPKLRGQQSEAAVLNAFVQHGIPVLQPFGDNERYDLVVEHAGSFHRVQVKTGRLENGRVQFETRSTGSSMTTVTKQGYTGEVDVFAVYAPELSDVFIVPIEETPETSMALRVEPPAKQSPNINWASDYTFGEWLNDP